MKEREVILNKVTRERERERERGDESLISEMRRRIKES